jgi:hypothetical protein
MYYFRLSNTFPTFSHLSKPLIFSASPFLLLSTTFPRFPPIFFVPLLCHPHLYPLLPPPFLYLSLLSSPLLTFPLHFPLLPTPHFPLHSFDISLLSFTFLHLSSSFSQTFLDMFPFPACEFQISRRKVNNLPFKSHVSEM